MASKAPVYVVACSTPECDWEEDFSSYHLARLAAQRHECANSQHTTFVFTPDLLRDPDRRTISRP
jgi:hypothetical protein